MRSDGEKLAVRLIELVSRQVEKGSSAVGQTKRLAKFNESALRIERKN